MAPTNPLADAPPLTSVLDSGQSSLPPPSGGKPATSIFANLGTPQPQQSSGSSQPQQTGNVLTNLSQPQQNSGLLGSSSQAGNIQQQPLTSSIFGGNQSTQGTGGGLFGSQSNSQQTGSVFGSQQSSQPGPLCGTSNAQASQLQQTGGLFASLAQNQSQSQQAQNPFGAFNNQNKASSLFGNTQAPAQTQQTATQPPPAPLFSSQIGQYNKQQTVPGVRVNLNELRPTTRFNDLHEEVQKIVENIDKFILSQIRKQEDCAAVNKTIDDMSSQIPSDVDYCTDTLDTMQRALENDAESIAFAKSLVKADFDNAKLSFKVIQNLSLPHQFHHSALRGATTPPQARGLFFPDDGVEEGPANIVDYFTKQANEMTKTLNTYDHSISEVESYLDGVESNTMQQMQQVMLMRTRDGGERSAEDQVRELAVVLREFGNGIMGVATKVGDTREKVQEIMLGPAESIRGIRGMRSGML